MSVCRHTVVGMRTSDATRPGGGAGAAAGDEFESAFVSIASALDGVTSVPAWSLGEQAVQARLGEALALRSRLAEVTARLVASASDRELPRLAGASSTRAWLMATHRVSAQDAGRLVR